MAATNDGGGFVPLREYLEARIELVDRHLESRIVQLDRLTDERFVTHKTMLDSNAEKVALALASADKAIDKETEQTDKRLDLLNELRVDIATKAELQVMMQRLDDFKETQQLAMAEMKTRLDKTEGKGLGLNAALGYLLAAVTIVVFAANYVFSQ